MKNHLKEIRRSRNLKQADVAKMLNVPVRTYGSWERGERELSLIDACDIADVLECTLDEIAGRSVPDADEETQLFARRFQSLNGRGRNVVMEMIEFELSKSSQGMPNHTIPGVA